MEAYTKPQKRLLRFLSKKENVHSVILDNGTLRVDYEKAHIVCTPNGETNVLFALGTTPNEIALVAQNLPKIDIQNFQLLSFYRSKVIEDSFYGSEAFAQYSIELLLSVISQKSAHSLVDEFAEDIVGTLEPPFSFSFMDADSLS